MFNIWLRVVVRLRKVLLIANRCKLTFIVACSDKNGSIVKKKKLEVSNGSWLLSFAVIFVCFVFVFVCCNCCFVVVVRISSGSLVILIFVVHVHLTWL